MAVNPAGSKIAVEKQALTNVQATTIFNAPKQSHVDALKGSKWTITYVFSQVLSLNGFIPFFFDFSKAKAADNKIAAELKGFNDAVAALNTATAARINQPKVSETAKNKEAYKAEKTKLQNAELKAVRKVSSAAFSLFASNVDMSKASVDAAQKSLTAFRRTVWVALQNNRGSLAKTQVFGPTGPVFANSAVKYLAKTTADVSQLKGEAKADFMKLASNVTGMTGANAFNAILRAQAHKSDAVLDAVTQRVEDLAKAEKKDVRFTSADIKAVKEERAEKRKTLETEIKGLNSEVRKAKKALASADKKLERAAEAFSKAINKEYVNANTTAESILKDFANQNYDEANIGNVLNQQNQPILNKRNKPLFDRIVVAHDAQVKAENNVAKLAAKQNPKKADLRDLKKQMRAARHNNANVLAELKANRRADLAAARANAAACSA